MFGRRESRPAIVQRVAENMVRPHIRSKRAAMDLDVAELFGHASIPGMSHRFGVFVRSLLTAQWTAVRGCGALSCASQKFCVSMQRSFK